MFLPNTFGKQSAPRTSGARRVLPPKTPNLIERALPGLWVGYHGLRAKGHVFGKRFTVSAL